MDEPTRRDMLHRTGALGLLAALAPPDAPPSRDRECVLAAGMTPGEADCWELAAKVAGKFFDLPELHPMDKAEVASAIHIIQNKLLSRPTYRKYLDAHKNPPPKP